MATFLNSSAGARKKKEKTIILSAFRFVKKTCFSRSENHDFFSWSEAACGRRIKHGKLKHGEFNTEN